MKDEEEVGVKDGVWWPKLIKTITKCTHDDWMARIGHDILMEITRFSTCSPALLFCIPRITTKSNAIT